VIDLERDLLGRILGVDEAYELKQKRAVEEARADERRQLARLYAQVDYQFPKEGEDVLGFNIYISPHVFRDGLAERHRLCECIAELVIEVGMKWGR